VETPSACAYLRISQDRKDERIGIEGQRREVAALADRLGCEIVHWYDQDNDISASTRSRRDRPDYRRMVTDARSGRFSVIMAYSSSRLTRRPRELEDLIELAETFGVRFEYVRSPSFDLNTADGRATARTLAAWDAAEAERTSERVRLAAETRRLRGRPGTSGRRPFGYGRDGRTVVEAEAELIRRGATWILEGASLLEVARRFDASGVAPVLARRWTPASIRGMYKRGRLAGFVVHRGEVVGKGDFPAIVDEAMWRSVRDKLAGRASGRLQAPRRHVLSGLVFCECGGRMQVQHAAPRPRTGRGGSFRRERSYFRCSKRDGGCGKVSRDYALIMIAADEFMREALGRVPEPSPMAEQTSETESRIAVLESEILAARRRFAAQQIAAEDFYPLLSELRGEINRLRRQLATTARRVVVLPDALEIWCDDQAQNLGRRIELARQFIRGVYVRGIGKGGHHRLNLRDTFEILPA
jgi:site-specific DNA recombinase